MPSFLDSLLGTKPKVPTLPTLDLGTEQQKAITANQAALPGAEKLVGAANQFSIDQINSMLEQAIPGYSNIVKTITGNIASEAQGQIPADVVAQEMNLTAGQALRGGYAGSPAHGDLVARDLALTSLDLTNRALSSMESWTKTAASLYEPSMINVSSMFISPQQQASFDVEERNAQFQRDWMASQIAALPAPWAEDLKQFVYRAMSAYSGTSVDANPYSTPGSFGSGMGGGGGYPYSSGAGEGGAGFDPYSTQFVDTSGGAGVDFGAGGNTGLGGGAEGVLVGG